ncbi:MAG TPA: CopG family antitoxin [Chloroflexia bacterium]|jgi:hypothetical protein
MEENEQKQLPTFESLDELVEFFETNSLGDYWESMPEVHFDVDIKRHRHLVELDADLVDKLRTAASDQHMSTEALVNSWLREKLSQAS